MIFLVVLVLMLAAFAFVSWPLLASTKGVSVQESSVDPEWNTLMDQRDAAYRAIKELDFDYQLGNLSQQDYQALRDGYRSRAAAILRSLDRLRRSAQAKGEPADAEAPASVAQATATVRAPAAEPPPLVGDAAGQAGLCPACGKPVSVSDRYCGSCGAEQRQQCPHCGTLRPASDIFCGNCGTRLQTRG